MVDCRYVGRYNEVHIDEKWFYLTKEKRKYILAPGEQAPNRTVQHKSHITKVMFLSAIARPRKDTVANQMWDGKLGIWPIGEWKPAVNNSVNRPAGTMEWHDISVTKDVYRHFLLYQDDVY